MTRSAKTLSAKDITVRFGGLSALTDVELTVEKGEILGLIGANGAGKSTLINVLSGFQKPHKGQVRLNGATISDKPPEVIARAGVVRTFQAVRLFSGLTVEDNVAAVAAVAARPAARVKDILELLSLTDLRDQMAGTLSYSNQRRLGIARTLALEPDFLLLDEPAAGMTPDEVADIDNTLVRLRDEIGLGLLLVEHNMAMVMGLCERLVVLDSGSVIARGRPADIQGDASVRAAYLGSEAQA